MYKNIKPQQKKKNVKYFKKMVVIMTTDKSVFTMKRLIC